MKYSDYAEEKGNSSVVFAKVLKEVYDKIESKKNVKLVDTDLNFMNRVITTGEQYSYIRIAEGCSNRCTYCAIPYIRGNFVSRKMENIIEEAKQIVATGRKELILITLGGETSYKCCSAIGAYQLQLIDEVAPAIALTLDHNAQWIVTKSGNLGGANTLIDILKYFETHGGLQDV